MSITAKISYKVYPNDRVKPIWFHGTQTPPLYIVVIHKRLPVYFKSYYFDLLTHSKYAVTSVLGTFEPVISQVYVQEKILLDHLVQRFANDFSIEEFKGEYLRLGKDLVFEQEKVFEQYLTTFFYDQGLPVLASLINEGSKNATAEHLLMDLRTSLKPDIFKKLIDNAVFYAPPYIPLCTFLRRREPKRIPMLSLLEWSSDVFRKDFKAFIQSEFPAYAPVAVEQYLNKLAGSFD